MTNEPPDRSGRHRSEAASRLAALLAEIETSEAAPPEGAAPDPTLAPSPSPPVPPAPAPASVAPAEAGDGPPTAAMPILDGEPSAPNRADAAVNEQAKAAPDLPRTQFAEMVTVDRQGPHGPVPTLPSVDGEAPAVPIGRAGLVSAPPKPAPVPPPPPVDAPVAEPSTTATVADADGAADPEIAPEQLQAVPGSAPTPTGDVAPQRRPRSLVRRVGFASALVVLLAAIPALGWVGKESLLKSQAGKVEAEDNDPRAPGFVQFIDPTLTALVVQRDADGAPTALTLLALGNGEAGGSVLFVPLDTNLVKPALFIDRLRTAYASAGDKSFITQVGKLLNVGFNSVVDLTDADWAEAVAPVAPLTIENPINTAAPDALFPAGPLQLQANQVGPYLNSTAGGQDDLDRLARHKLVWEAWFEAIATSAAQQPVPNTLTGIGPFVATLAAGPASLDTLAVTPAALLAPDGATAFQPDAAAMRTQLTDAVPAPVSPGLGDRYSVRLLNGVSGDPIPEDLIRTLVYGGAQVDALGNAAAFDRESTRIEYHQANRKETARAVQFLLGGGTVVMNASSTDTVDLVITLGRDVLDE